MSCFPHKRVWIVGAQGFLGSELRACMRGSHVEYEAAEGGLQPRVVPHCTEAEQAAAMRHVLAFDPALTGEGVPACVQAPGVIAQAVAAAGEPEVVYFCAATHGGDAAAYRRAYLEPVLAVAAAIPQARLVFCSSTAVYEGRGRVTEESPTRRDSEKLCLLQEAEQAVLGAQGVVARLAPLYGRGRCELLRRHLAGEPQLPGPPERMLNYLHVACAARVLRQLGTHPQLRYHVYNVCGESFTKAQVYALLESLTGVPTVREVSPAGRRGVSDHQVVADRLWREVCEEPVSMAAYVRASCCEQG